MTRRISSLMIVVFVGLWTASCAAGSGADTNAWPPAAGGPQAQSVADAPVVRLLRNPGFVVGYDWHRGRAAWVAYRVAPVTQFQPMRRPEFRPDPRVEHAAPRRVYWGPEYDRGHLAPNYAMAQLYGADAQRASFYFSNVAPQTQRLNQLVWQRLEEIEIDQLAPKVGELWVLVGPIYNDDDSNVPSSFFRIWLDRTSDDRWRALALRVPQNVRGDERLTRFLVSVDAVEQATGLDFFAGLPARVEPQVEAAPANAERWGFDDYACFPARYSDDWQGRGGIDLDFDRCG